MDQPPDDDRPVLVSACLTGEACRYDGADDERRDLLAELRRTGARIVPFCPEREGGLPTPRPAAWIEAQGAGAALDGNDRVVTGDGTDVTEAFVRGAHGALETCRRLGIQRALLKERSPSCGVRHTHVADRLVAGPGLTAELLRRAGVEVRGVD